MRSWYLILFGVLGIALGACGDDDSGNGNNTNQNTNTNTNQNTNTNTNQNTNTNTNTNTDTCGDGTVDPGEECDSGDLNGATCSLDWGSGGAMQCTASCLLDASNCEAGTQWGTGEEEFVNAATRDSAGNFYVTGSTRGDLAGSSHGETDAFVTKLDSSGNLLWTAQWGAIGADTARGIQVGPSGDIYVTGETEGGGIPDATPLGSQDIFLTKLTADGSTLWTRIYGTDQVDSAFDLLVLPGGSLVMTGFTQGDWGGSQQGWGDGFVARLDADGAVLWLDQWGSTGSDQGTALAMDSAGNLYVAGEAHGSVNGQPYGGNLDNLVIKYDPDGAVLWTLEWGELDDDWVWPIAVAPDGNLVVAGYTTMADTPPGVGGGADYTVTKISPEGIIQWDFAWGSYGEDYVRALAVDALGNSYVGGYTRGVFEGWVGLGDDDLFLAKINPQGEQLWVRQWGTAGEDQVDAILPDDNGHLFLAGYATGDLVGAQQGLSDAFLLQTTALP